jgi:mycofactocin biosynthesis protein MftB
MGEASAASTGRKLDLERAYHLAEQVSLRPEGFGALAYHFGNRRLTFLTSQLMVQVVDQLDGDRPLQEILEDHVPPGSRKAVEDGLATLVAADVVQPVAQDATEVTGPVDVP